MNYNAQLWGTQRKFYSLPFLPHNLFLLLLILPLSFMAQSGLPSPEPIGPYLNGVLSPERPSNNTNYKVERAFSRLTFNTPFKMQKDPSRNRFFLAEKRGHVVVFDRANNGTNKRTVLNIENRVSQGGGAHGFMGFALHPEFGQANSPNKGYFYVFYRYIPNPNMLTSEDESYRRLSRFTYNENTGRAEPNSEQVLIQQFVTSRVHTGGGMRFGPDGMLYVGIGDGGVCCEQISTQRLDRYLLAGIFRIDVDRRGGNISHPIRRQPTDYGNIPNGWPKSFTANYFIPNDNPWLDPNGGILEEFYALGIRHPYTLSYDPGRDEWWEGDVGELTWEEVNKIEKGANYEWPFLEADNVHRSTLGYAPRNINQVTGRRRGHWLKLNRDHSNSVIGGFVYRGNRYPSLVGKYILGDHNTGRIWTINANRSAGNTQADLDLLAVIPNTSTGRGIASFATDESGEIYVIKMNGVRAGSNNGGGIIYRITTEGQTVQPPPARLSQTGAFTDLATLTPAQGIIPYTVNSPLWSDGSLKKRWIAIPNDGTHNANNERVSFDATQEWSFPEGTVLIKHFELPIDENDPTVTTRLETRFIILGRGGEYSALTYRWNNAQTDATLLNGSANRDITIQTANGNTRTQTWTFPSRVQCFSCHTESAGRVLGVNTQQLNGPLTYPSTGITANQLDTWKHLGIFQQNVGVAQHYFKAAPIGASNASLQHQVRSYLDANCASCHRPNGVEARFDARLSTPLALTEMVDARVSGSASTPGSVVLKPGNPSESELFVRSISSAGNLMPPLGRSVLDDDYLQSLQTWIENMVPPSPFDEIGETGQVDTDERWTTVTLSGTYKDPVVIVGPPSFEGAEQSSVRVRNVTANSFEIKVDEWEVCLDQNHAFENISYLVVEAGTYKLPNGKVMTASNISLDHKWKTAVFPQRFSSAPVVLASCVSENEADAVVVRIDETLSSNDRVTLRLQEQQGGGSIKGPEISFEGLTISESIPQDSLRPIDRDNYHPNLPIRPVLKSDYLSDQLRLAAHAEERVSILAIEPGVNTVGGEFEVGVYDQVSSSWEDVSFAKFYSAKPFVLAGMGSYRDADPAGLRYDQDISNGGLLRIFAEEDPCGDAESNHNGEQLNFLVGEMGIRLYGEKVENTQGFFQNRLLTSNAEFPSLTQSFSMFPNPTRDKIIIDIQGPRDQEYELILFDSSGKKLMEKWVKTGIQELSLPKLPRAVYFMKMKTFDYEEIQKLVVQ